MNEDKRCRPLSLILMAQMPVIRCPSQWGLMFAQDQVKLEQPPMRRTMLEGPPSFGDGEHSCNGETTTGSAKESD
ncbi:hypothetical protein L3X38_004651 [Prunus dulcis]|uniref:Uncharacterized protein n=1 Tax=Prunus dulcis TaxID=3755 RepID=A0AAD4ZPB6_PRUDU|nr:hypothetical protein L3X38_004651 [Prunus dulcis]